MKFSAFITPLKKRALLVFDTHAHPRCTGIAERVHATEQASSRSCAAGLEYAASTPARPTRFQQMVRQRFVLLAFTLIGAPALAAGTPNPFSASVDINQVIFTITGVPPQTIFISCTKPETPYGSFGYTLPSRADACNHHIPQPELAQQTPIEGKRAALCEANKGTFQ